MNPQVCWIGQENITEVPQITIEHVPVEKVVKKPVETGWLGRCSRISMWFTWLCLAKMEVLIRKTTIHEGFSSIFV